MQKWMGGGWAWISHMGNSLVAACCHERRSRFGGKSTTTLRWPILDRAVTFGSPEVITLYVSVTRRPRNFYYLFHSGSELTYNPLFNGSVKGRNSPFTFTNLSAKLKICPVNKDSRLIVISRLFCRSDEDDPSGCKYRRLDDDNVQDKERFARWVSGLI